MALHLGINSKFYLNPGSFGSPTWGVVNGISDLQYDPKWDEGSGTTRVSPVKMYAPTQLDIPISGQHLCDDSTNYTTLEAAFYARTVIDVMVLNGSNTTNGTTGVRFNSYLFEWTVNQGLDQVEYRKFTIKPAIDGTNLPKTVAVSGGAAAFTSIA